jgi:hypothetical protein
MHGFERQLLPGIGVCLSIVTSQACHGSACMRWLARTRAGPCWFGFSRVLMRHRLAACGRGVGAPLAHPAACDAGRLSARGRRRCGECQKGDIDQDLNGNGRYDVEWYGVPCNVGDSKLSYVTVSKSQWIFAFVVANHRHGRRPPVALPARAAPVARASARSAHWSSSKSSHVLSCPGCPSRASPSTSATGGSS